MFGKLKVLGVAAVAAILMAAPAQAATIIDFRNGSAPAGGNVTFDGTNAIGVNLPIGLVEVFQAPNLAANGVFQVFGTVGVTGAGDLDFNTGSNTVSIVGCIPGLGLGTLNAAGQCSQSFTLLSGTITGEEFRVSQSGGGVVEFFGTDTKHPALLQAIGLSPTTPFEVFAFALTTGALNAQGNPSISTDIRNTAVPEPATMMLLGTGLLAAFRARRKQQA